MQNSRLLRRRGPRRGVLAAGLTAGLVAGGATGLFVTGDNARAQDAGTNSIHISLDVQPDAAQDFPFDTTGAGLENFVLDDDADPTLSNAKHFENLVDGLYVVAGPDIPGWSLTGLLCDTETSSDTGETASRSSVSAAAAFRLEGGDNASCTFTYSRVGEPLGSLTVVKDVINDDGGELEAADFQISVLKDGTDVAGSPAAGSAEGTAYELEAGEYVVSEAMTEGYTGTFGGDCSAMGVVNVPANGAAVCTLTNHDDAETGSITIVKAANPADGTDFSFTAPSLGDDFMLDVDNDETLSDSITFEDLEAGAYSVSEIPVEGWKLVDVLCTGTPMSRDTDIPADNTVDIQLGEGSHITCTFVNEKERPTGTATLSITKEAGDAEGSAVSFSATGLYDSTGFELDDDPATETSDTIVFTDLPAGEVAITELAAEGWQLAAITCRGGGTTSDIATATLTANLVDGANVRCTFINTPTDEEPVEGGSLTIVKDAGDAEDSETSFTTTGLLENPGFSLDDDATTDLSDTEVIDGLAAGPISVTEIVPDGWMLTSIVCTDTADTTVELETASVTVNLGMDEDVVCTFVNEPIEQPLLGSITIVKEADVADGTDFSFTGTGIGEEGFILDVDDDATNSNTIVFDNLEAGNYAVTEEMTEGWTLADVTCTGLPPTLAPEDLTDNTVDIALGEGASIVCTFVNTQDVVEPTTGSITITKDAGDAADSAVSFTTTGGLDGDAGFTLDDDSETLEVLDTVSFADLDAGTYSVTELAAEGWILNAITCEGGANVVTDVATGLATITLAEGEDVTCTYTNEADVVEPMTGSITIVKDAGDMTGSAASFTTTGGLNGDAGFTLDDDSETLEVLDTISFDDLDAGTYSVTELAAEGWTLNAITCEGGANVVTDVATGLATITLAEGEDVTCTYDNDPETATPGLGNGRGPGWNENRSEVAKQRLEWLFAILLSRWN